MPSQNPSRIPIPAEFETASVDEKRAYLARLRDQLRGSLVEERAAAEDALFGVIEERRREMSQHPERALSVDELIGPLREKYAGS